MVVVQNLSYKRLLKGLPENPEQWRRGQRKKVESLTPDHLLFRKDSALRVRAQCISWL